MRLPKPRPIEPTVPVAAPAGVVLLLVFFFLLSTSYSIDRGDVDLPEAPGLHEAPPGAACLIVERRVGVRGEELSWKFSERDDEVHDLPGPEALFFEASRIVDVDPERTFLLRFDARIRYAVVDDALETLRRAGVRNVVLGGRPVRRGA
ncbi:MAG TPA: biopolymer transporter ExbD [Candidatus Polarisedimenticolaceae bacterium]|nr:biopolymer transporter ExbD [Candidatus Polarisedimenticolaceae bacterium]